MPYDPKNPYAATVNDLLESCMSLNAKTMKITGEDDHGTPVFVVFVAVMGEAPRALKAIERLEARSGGGTT